MGESSGVEVTVKGSKQSSNKEDDIALMTELGWIKDKKEAESLMTQQAVAINETDDAENNINTLKKANTTEENEPSQPRQLKNKDGDNGGISKAKNNTKHTRREGKRKGFRSSENSAATMPFDYSTVGNISAYDPKVPMSNSPFFTGAAISGGSITKQNGPNPERKKSGTNSKGKQMNITDRPGKRDGNKSFVYRANQR